MFYRPGNSPKRIARNEDEAFVDTSGQALDWLPVTAADTVMVMTAKAALNTTPNPALFQIQKFREFVTASIDLQMKRGGTDDIEAMTVEEWENAGVVASIPIIAPGFVRLRLGSYTPPFYLPEGGSTTVSMGVWLRIYVSKTQVAVRPQ